MSIEIFDYLKRERDICVKTIIVSVILHRAVTLRHIKDALMP